LYSRFRIRLPFEEWKDNNEISASIFQFTKVGDSFNRELYSESPSDVLLNTDIDGGDLSTYGIFGFKCEVVSNCTPFIDDVENSFSMSIKHDPTPCMFPHSIILVLKNNIYDGSKSRLANAEFRDQLKSNLVLYKPVDVL
jgi:hypothetical protein